jgi:hypothetical protein
LFHDYCCHAFCSICVERAKVGVRGNKLQYSIEIPLDPTP